MNAHSGFFLTVGELAFSLRLFPKEIKRAANANSISDRLDEMQLDKALACLKEKLAFQCRGWDLTMLEGYNGEWVDSLRYLYSLPVAFPASLPPSQGIQIRELILREVPCEVLEIGCFVGISSHWIASALEEIGTGHLDSVDSFWPKYPNRFHFSYLQDPYAVATKTASKSKHGKRITFHHSDSITYASNLPPEKEYDFMFIDGDHSFDGVTQDFLAYFPHLRQGGVILLHDTNPEHCGWKGPRLLIDRLLANNPNVSVEEIETTPNFGMAIIRKICNGASLFNGPVPTRIAIRQSFHKLIRKIQGSPPVCSFIRKIAKPALAVIRRFRETAFNP
jgi:cephalosporin hydroxylase